MIPTRIRSKIPNVLSYPLGAKAISDALAGVPQFDALAIDFWFYRPNFRAWSSATAFPVLSASYSNFPPNVFTPRDWVENGHSCVEWRVRVEAVPRTLRHQIAMKLTTEALPTIREWLIASSGAEGRQGTHALMFSYDESAEELRREETSSVAWHTIRR